MNTRPLKLGFLAFILFLNLILLVNAKDITLFESGRNSRIVYPGKPHTASITSYNYSHPENVGNAQWIWDGAGWNVPCNLKIGVEQKFTLPCPGKDIVLRIAADNNYQFKIGDVQGSGGDWTKVDEHRISTEHYKCNDTLVLRIIAKNDGTDCNGENPAGLIFAGYTEECSTRCEEKQFWNPRTCACSSCASYLPGCQECTSTFPPKCKACDSVNGYMVWQDECKCKVGYYKEGPSCLACTDEDKKHKHPECRIKA